MKPFEKGSLRALALALLLSLQPIAAVETETGSTKSSSERRLYEDEGPWSRMILQNFGSYPSTSAPTPSYQTTVPKPIHVITPSHQSELPRPAPAPSLLPTCGINVRIF